VTKTTKNSILLSTMARLKRRMFVTLNLCTWFMFSLYSIWVCDVWHGNFWM